MAHLSTALGISLLGITVVFGALVLIGLVIALLGRLGTERTTPDAVSDDGISPEIVAAISAAVMASMGAGVRVKRVRYGRTQESGWVEQGRIIISASHQPRP